MPGQIAQLIVPSDGIGNPEIIIPNWPAASVFFIAPHGLRRYALALETQSPAVSVAFSPSPSLLCAGVDPVSGSLLLQRLQIGGEPLEKYDPTTLTLTASYGPPDSPISFTAGQGLCCVACGTLADPAALVGYAFLKEDVFATHITGFRVSDTLTINGFRGDLTAGSFAGRGILCAGASGPSGGSVFATWQGSVTGAVPTFPLQKITISPGAELYDPTTWPTTNPYITIATVGTIAAADVDPTWTNLACYQLGFDSADGNVLMDMHTSDAVATQHYLIKVNAVTGAVIWASAILPNDTGTSYSVLSGLSIRHALAGLLPFGQSQLVDTVSGSPTTALLPGVASGTLFGGPGGDLGAVIASDTSALYFVSTTYTGSTPDAPVAVAGTPSSFAGYAIIGGIIPAPALDVTVADLWFGATVGFVDLSATANRRLFVGLDGSGQYLGANGERPFGAAPPVFLTRPGSGSAADTFADNAGTGAAFAITGGALATATPGPHCSTYRVALDLPPNTPQGADPQVMLSVSDDGGRTFSSLQKWRSMGKIGEYTKRLRWMKMGKFRNRMIRLEITDPVRRNLIGFYLDVTEGLD